MKGNKGRSQQQGKGGEFRSGEPTTEEYQTGAHGTVNREAGTGNIITRKPVDPEIADALKKYSDRFHEARAGSREAKKNPLYDLRKDPATRFQDYLESEWNEFGSDTKKALAHATKVFEEQGENIAGRFS